MPKFMNEEERFWAKVVKHPGDACWEWTACRFKPPRSNFLGYGCFSFRRKLQGAHRVSWILHNGPIPDGMWVLHKCDNPPCCNPAHLFLGSPKDNVLDMVAKGRNAPPRGDDNWMRKIEGIQAGANNFNARLTEEDVMKIKPRILAGEHQRALASSFGVSVATIAAIAGGTNWNHVPWPEGASFSIDCNRALRSRGIRKASIAITGGICVEDGCLEPVTGANHRCDEHRAARRTISKRDHARLARCAVPTL